VTLFRRFATYGLLNVVHGLVVTTAAAVAAGLLYRRLGSEFGLLALITGGMLRLNLVDDSLGTWVITLVSADDGRGAGDVSLARIALAAQLYTVLSIVFGGGFAAAVALLLHRHPDVASLAVLAGAGLLLTTVGNLFAKLLEGGEEYLILRSAQSAVSVLRMGAVVVLFTVGVATLVPYVLLYVAFHLGLLGLLAALAVRRSSVRLPRGWWRRRPARSELGEVGRFLRPLLVAKGAAVVSYRLDLWVVQGLAGATATAAYAMAEALSGFAAQSIEVLKALLPVSVRDWRRDPGWIRGLVLGTSKGAFLLVGAVCAVAAAAAPPILEIWFGDAPPLAVIASRLLLFFYALTSFRSALQIVLTGQGLFHVLERPFVVAAAVNLTLSLAATWLFGGWGAALGTALSGGYLLLANLRQAERALGVDRDTVALRVVLPGLAVLTAAVTAGALLPLPDLVLGFATRILVAGGVFVTAFWLFVLNRDERSLLIGYTLALRRIGG
jgi:O-antigen/teichoic acid export membrane protein